jgi:hypothetical protein
MTHQDLFDKAFESHEVIAAGSLRVPTGRLVACDPFLAMFSSPLTRTVQPGEYDVQLCMADAGDQGRRVALARLVIAGGARSASVEPAAAPPLGGNSYLVDSGLGAFMDEATRTSFVDIVASYHENPDANYYTGVLAEEFRESSGDRADPYDPGAWTIHRLPGSCLNVAMFASGRGDGMYESFWCLDGAGDAVALVTDFGVIEAML